MKKFLTISAIALIGGMVVTGARNGNAEPLTKAVAADHVYIDKALDQYALQAVIYNGTANRFTISVCVPASVDHPESSVLRKGYGTDLQETVDTLNPATNTTDIQARIAALNLFNGYLLIDDHPITEYSRTDYGFWNENKGRMYLTRNADSETDWSKQRLKIAFDVCIPDSANKLHTITIKEGAELPSWSYALGLDIGSTTKESVYRNTQSLKSEILIAADGKTVTGPKCKAVGSKVDPTCVGTFGYNESNEKD